MNVKALYWVLLALCGVPVPILGMAWVSSIRNADLKARSLVPLIVLTGSLGWAIVAWNVPEALGPSYNGLRYAIINANFFASLVCLVLAFRQSPNTRALRAAACATVTILWGLIAAVNSGFSLISFGAQPTAKERCPGESPTAPAGALN